MWRRPAKDSRYYPICLAHGLGPAGRFPGLVTPASVLW